MSKKNFFSSNQKKILQLQKWNKTYLAVLLGYETNFWHHQSHGLRTPNEGINQRNLKFWAYVADKICFHRKGTFYSEDVGEIVPLPFIHSGLG